MAGDGVDQINFFKLNKLELHLLEQKDEIVLLLDGKYRTVERGALYNVSYLLDLLIIWIETHFQGAQKIDVDKARTIAQAKDLFSQAKEVGDPKKLLSKVGEYRKRVAMMSSSPELKDLHDKVIECLTEIASRCSTPDEALFALALRQEAGDLLFNLPPVQVVDPNWKETIEELSKAADFRDKLMDLANGCETARDAVIAMALRDKAAYAIDESWLNEIDLTAIFNKFVSREIRELQFHAVESALRRVDIAREQLEAEKAARAEWVGDSNMIDHIDNEIVKKTDEYNGALKGLTEAIRESEGKIKSSSAFENLSAVSGLADRIGNTVVKGAWTSVGTAEFKALGEARRHLNQAFDESKQRLQPLARVESDLIGEVRQLKEKKKKLDLDVRYPEIPFHDKEAVAGQKSAGWWGAVTNLFWGSEELKSPLHAIADWAESHGVEGFNLNQLRLISADLYLRVAPEGVKEEEKIEGYIKLKKEVMGREGSLTGEELLGQIDAVLGDVNRALQLARENSTTRSNHDESRRSALEAQMKLQQELLGQASKQIVMHPGMMFYQTQKTAIETQINTLQGEIAKLDQPQVSPSERHLLALKGWLEKARKEAEKVTGFTESVATIADDVESRDLQRSELHKRLQIALEVVPRSSALISDLNSIESLLTLGQQAL